MLPTRQSKRRLGTHKEAPKSKKKRVLLSNLTNFKSPTKAREGKEEAGEGTKEAREGKESREGIEARQGAEEARQGTMKAREARKELEVKEVTKEPATQATSGEGSSQMSQVPSTQFSVKAENSVEMMRTIKRVLEEDFKSVCERLCLQSVPPCLYDLKKCHQLHSRNNQIVVASYER
jgi:hypothetical protein